MAQSARRIACVAHGGAGYIKDSAIADAVEGVKAAALAGFSVLQRGGSSVDCVEAAVRVLESNARFNAGIGSALNEAGAVEMDALIMRGSDRALGSVTGVQTTRSAVALARAVMESSPHVMLAGAPADAFAARIGLEQVRGDERRECAVQSIRALPAGR